MRHVLRLAVVFTVLLVVVTPAFAGSGAKLGSKVLLFNEPTITMDAKSDAEVGQLQFKVTDETVRLHRVVVSFADGSTETVDCDITLWPGAMSEPLMIGRAGTVKSLELDYRGTQGADRARLTVYGS